MPNKIKDIGKPDMPPGSRRNRLHGGETWTIITKPVSDIALDKDDRLRVEAKGANTTMYPDVGTRLYDGGYQEIPLAKQPSGGNWELYSYTALLNGNEETLYFAEGSGNPGEEAEIWDCDPRDPACRDAKHGNPRVGGTAGLRR